MQVTIRLTGTGAIINAMNAALEKKKALVCAAIQKTGLDCEAQAKQSAPVDTGFLKNSIHYEKTGEASCTVSVGASYAVYQEFGTSKMPAHPFLFPAFVSTSNSLAALLQKVADA